MNKLIAVLKKIRISQILMVFMAGVLLFVSTACGGPGGSTEVQTGTRQEMPAGKQGVPNSVNPRPEVPGGTATSPDSDVINRFQRGTMNEFSDLDPRTKQQGTAAEKAETLRESAQQNIDQPGNVGDKIKRSVGEDVGKNLRQGAEDVKSKAKGATDDLVQGTKQATENAKDSTLNATRGINRSVNQAAEGAKEDTKATGRNLIDDAKQAVENTRDFVQGKTNQAAEGAKSGLDKTRDVVD